MNGLLGFAANRVIGGQPHNRCGIPLRISMVLSLAEMNVALSIIHICRWRIDKRKMNTMDAAREIQLNRNMVAFLYKETAQRIDLEAIDKHCDLFEFEVGDLLKKLDYFTFY